MRRLIVGQVGPRFGLVDHITCIAGMVGMLQRSEVDIQLGALTVLAAREQVSAEYPGSNQDRMLAGH
jgi:hypothetical protein